MIDVQFALFIEMVVVFAATVCVRRPSLEVRMDASSYYWVGAGGANIDALTGARSWTARVAESFN